MQLARVLGGIGRVLITAGVLVLLFVAYQLWGTGIQEARAQNSLENDFAEQLDEAGIDADAGEATTPSTQPGTSEPPPTQAAPPPPPEGDAAAQIRIPKIGVDKIVVEGVSVADLRRGPGHYPETPMPGQPGNASIAGHRTTYGAPFNRIDELVAGDEILVTTLQGAFRYEVFEQRIVSPSASEVLDDFGDNRLTLTACHPKYSARQRIVVVARLVGPAAAVHPTEGVTPTPAENSDDTTVDDEQASGETIDTGLSGESASAWPAVLLAVACALIWLAAWVAAKIVKPWAAYAVGAPIFFVVLFFFYESFYRLLPANF